VTEWKEGWRHAPDARRTPAPHRPDHRQARARAARLWTPSRSMSARGWWRRSSPF